MRYFFAPVQGHTDAAYRHFHNKLYNDQGISFTTPFIRLEKNEIRKKDLKDISSELNHDIDLVPQIIFRDKEELETLVKLMKEQGKTRIDLNMGCPFPLQVSHHRGAATICDSKLGENVAETIFNNPDINFSVKIRLGVSDPKEWHNLLSSLNKVKIDHLTVHPRVAKQQYDGDLYLEEFKEILRESKNPVVFNGDIASPSNFNKIREEFKDIDGVMIGRGVLARPSIFNEIISGEEWDKDKRIDKMMEFHKVLYSYYSSVLCGENQLLSKIKPFWEYAEDEIGRKAWKQINKASTIAKYKTAVAMVKD